ncbi:hypothetical protein C3B59_00975 [Cryobacterium zongtaii]|uniref:Uncharacterized protein n=1 Tax=Cryobacterium zongtaii TaxID=1259217 RepID=A0A2S3ZPS2_9MICO|nr:hypothetical protein [Cryobacterium zongtaii]POH71211.1 hypothetical protein C3B59_00975 [Cryobacterium zongtaii]
MPAEDTAQPAPTIVDAHRDGIEETAAAGAAATHDLQNAQATAARDVQDAQDTAVGDLQDAHSTAVHDVRDTQAGAAHNAQDAQIAATAAVLGSVGRAAGSTSRAVAAGGAAVAVTFSDVEAMTTSIQSLNRLVAPMIGTVAALAVDPDLLESLVLSPLTGANAEAAALRAATRLTTQLVVTESLALVTASVVTTYQLADSALQASAAALGGGVSVGGSVVGGAVTVAGTSIRGAGDVVGAAAAGAWDVTGAAITGIGGFAGAAVLGAGSVAGVAVTGAGNVAGAAASGVGGVAAARADLAVTMVTGAGVAVGLAGALATSFKAGVLQETAETLAGALTAAADQSQENPVGDFRTRGIPLPVAVGVSFFENFSWSDVSANAAANVGALIGATGPYFDDIVGMIIHDGQTLGMFNDGEATLGGSGLSANELSGRTQDSVTLSEKEILGGAGEFTTDTVDRIVPRDVSSLFASSKQIDATGKEDFAQIRIFDSVTTVERPPGTMTEEHAYTVQIPSTLVWDPYSGAAPNDITADLLALHGDQTALMDAVFDAMEKEGIPTGLGAPPVMTTGFSLGGITAAAMAADPRGYNIQQVVTAGSPISEMAIPDGVDVIALAADEDLVAVGTGGQNPETWTTVGGSGSLLSGESDSTVMHAINVHNANRYAVMAAEHPEINEDSAVTSYFAGDVTVSDYYATRK